MTRLGSLLIATLLAVACANGTPADEPEAAVELTRCTDPRPQACTREYLPVCASRDTGIRCVQPPCPSRAWRTYANACEACSDPAVVGHRPGACEEE